MRRTLARLVVSTAAAVFAGVGALAATTAPAQAECVSGQTNSTGQFVCTQTSTPTPPTVRPGPQNVAYNGSGSKHSSSGRSGQSGGKTGPTFLFNKNAPGQKLMTGQNVTTGCNGALTTTTVNRRNQVTGQNQGTAPTRACAQPQQGQQQANAGPPPPPQITPQQAAQTAMAKLQFTAAGPGAGPTSADNDLPFDAPVGYPVWLWANGGTTADRTVDDAVDGMAVRINVHFDHLTWDAGDSTGTFSCGTGTEWVKGGAEPAAKSPTCDHVYQDMGRYTITATTHWTITWAAGGEAGTEPMAIAQTRPFSVGELQTVLTS